MPYQDTKLLLFALIKLEKFCTKAGGCDKKSAEKTLASYLSSSQCFEASAWKNTDSTSLYICHRLTSKTTGLGDSSIHFFTRFIFVITRQI